MQASKLATSVLLFKLVDEASSRTLMAVSMVREG